MCVHFSSLDLRVLPALIGGWVVDAESGVVVDGVDADDDDATVGWQRVGNSPQLTDVYNGVWLRQLYGRLFGSSLPPSPSSRPYTMLPSCTWMRAKGPGEVTAEHVDYYYFYKESSIFRDHMRAPTAAAAASPRAPPSTATATSVSSSSPVAAACRICDAAPRPSAPTVRCDLCLCSFHPSCMSPPLRSVDVPSGGIEWHCYGCCNAPLPYWTCWISLGELGPSDGRLAVVPGSHRLVRYESPAVADLLPGDATPAWMRKAQWVAPASIRRGDIVLFNMKLVHAATKNDSERFRFSIDTRVTSVSDNSEWWRRQ